MLRAYRLIAAILIASPMLASAQQTPDPCATAPASCATLIATHATSRTRLPNTVVDVVVAVTASGKDLPTVQRSLTDKTGMLLKFLRDQQVQRLMTSRVSFSPDTKSNPEKIFGYSGRSTVTFRASPDKVGEVLAGVLSNGASTISSTNFTPTEEEIAKARRELSADATRTAIAQAESISAAAGLHLVSVRKIDVDNSGPESFKADRFSGGGLEMLDGYTGGRNAPQMDTSAGDREYSIEVDVVVAASH